MFYLNVYRVTRHYGGSEEGGWWYNAGVPLASVPIKKEDFDTDEKRIALLKEWEKKFADQKWGKWDSEKNERKAERLLKKSWSRADELYEEMEEMLHRLIRIRGYLWT